MVKVGFICEGDTDKIIVESQKFKDLLKDNSLQFVKAENARGKYNLEPGKIQPFINNLLDEKAEVIIILTDLDDDINVTKTKERINAPEGMIVIVAKQEVEAWFLADSNMLSKWFKKNFEFEYPELESDPRQVLKNLSLINTGRGIWSSKPKFANSMINNGFSILNAAAHPNCSSAKYFINKLQTIN